MADQEPHLPHWFNKDREDRNRRSAKQERKRAKETGGRTQPGSGSSWRAPQDNVTPDLMEQVKFTDKGSFPLKAEELLSVLSDALQHGRDAGFVIEFSQYNVRLVGTIELVR